MNCNERACTCTNVECKNHGKCCACVMHHREKGAVPGCFFTPEGEKLWKRDFETFFKDRGFIKE